MSINYQRITDVFRTLALQAGDKIMEIYDSGDFEVMLKSDESPVTLADQLADQVISAGIRAEFPDIALVTEEQAQSHDVKAQTFIIVDPLDGTKEFIKRRGEFTVNIALVEDGVPTRGVVYAPALQRIFYTDENGASFEEVAPFSESVQGEMTPMKVRDSDNDNLIVVASKSHRDQATDAYISKYNVADMTGAGSSLKFCLIATGEADLYPRLGRTMEWDTAAGHAVLLGSGGNVVEFSTQETLRYGKADYANPFFIAYSPSTKLLPA